MDGYQIEQLLKGRAEEVCWYLLPNGQRDRDEWCTGNLDDKAATGGGSLRIHLTGAKTGWWCDFKHPELCGHTLAGLWSECRRITFMEALSEARKWLGVGDLPRGWKRQRASGGGRRGGNSRGSGDWPNGGQRPGSKQYERPRASRADTEKAEKKIRPLVKGGVVYCWLVEDRGLAPEVLERYGVGEMPAFKRQDGTMRGPFAVYPTRDPEGKFVSAKFRSIREKSDQFVQPRNAPIMLFGMHAILPNHDGLLFITEGENDALALASEGYPAVNGAPFGAQAKKKLVAANGKLEDPPPSEAQLQWIESCWEWMEQFVRIYDFFDGDDPGREGAAIIVPRLGRERCWSITYPEGCKDANDVLLLDPPLIHKLVDQAKPADPVMLKAAGEFTKQIWNNFFGSPEEEPGWAMPWPIPFKIREREITVFQGYSHHGKSIILNHVILHLVHSYKLSCCLASMEMPATDTLENTMRQAIARRKPVTDEGKPNEVQFYRAMEWMDQYFWVYDCLGGAKVADMLEVFGYAARRHGVKLFVIDSLMMMDIHEDDHDRQKEFMNDLAAFAKEYAAHVFLVAHSKKPDQKRPENKYWARKHDILGSVHISNIAHNIVCIHRNLKKEEDLENLKQIRPRDESEEDRLERLHDALFIVQKQRKTGKTVHKRLWFDAGGSWQYCDRFETPPRRYI